MSIEMNKDRSEETFDESSSSEEEEDASSDEEETDTKLCRCGLPQDGHPQDGRGKNHNRKKIEEFEKLLKSQGRLPAGYVRPKPKKKKPKKKKRKNDPMNFDMSQNLERQVEDRVSVLPRDKPKPSSQQSILGKRKRPASFDDDNSNLHPPAKKLKSVRHEVAQIESIIQNPPDDPQEYVSVLDSSFLSAMVDRSGPSAKEEVQVIMKAKKGAKSAEDEMKKEKILFEDIKSQHEHTMLSYQRKKRLFDMKYQECIQNLQKKAESIKKKADELKCHTCGIVMTDKMIYPSCFYTCTCAVRLCFMCAGASKSCPKCKNRLVY